MREKRNGLAERSSRNIFKGICNIMREKLICECAVVARIDNLGIIRHGADKPHGCALHHFKHISLCCLHAPAAKLIYDKSHAGNALGIEKRSCPLCGTYGGTGGRNDDIRRIRDRGGEQKRLADATGGIYEYEIVSAAVPVLGDGATEGKCRESAVKRIRCGDEKQIFASSVRDDRTLGRYSAENDIAYIIERFIGETEQDIHASVSEIAVYDEHALSEESHRHGKIGTYGRFADAALAGGEKYHFCF